MDARELQRLSGAIANERSLEKALGQIVEGLAEQAGIVLARIWLIHPGDICQNCKMKSECPDQTSCLHLAASDGFSLKDKELRWNTLEGSHRRFPLGARKVGRIGKTGEPALLQIVGHSADWARDTRWVRDEKISSFAGQPLMFRGQIFGVIAIFSRTKLDGTDLSLLRTFADNSAAAIANARAFEEIESLRLQLELENEYLREEINSATVPGDFVGASHALQKTLRQVELVAPTDTTVLIQGESGTGKELVARRIHDQSSRSDRPLIKVNCASVPRELFESEFFGHVKGAFSGAVRDRRGRFELADGGTLFLDEIGEIPMELQSKLLRALQEGVFERIGEERSREVDIRIIAATNRDLKREVAEGRFREDLYYRLSVFPIETIPLRLRTADIPPLAQHFLNLACQKIGVEPTQLRKKHIQGLKEYVWPGNVRELQNIIERAVIVSQGQRFQLDIPGIVSAVQDDSFQTDSETNISELTIETYSELTKFERKMIVDVLREAGGKISGIDGAASRLGIPPSTLTSRMAKLKIKRKSEIEFCD